MSPDYERGEVTVRWADMRCMLSRVVLVEVEIIGRLVGDACLTGYCCLCAVSMCSEFFSALVFVVACFAQDSGVWGPETGLDVNPTHCCTISDRMRRTPYGMGEEL